LVACKVQQYGISEPQIAAHYGVMSFYSDGFPKETNQLCSVLEEQCNSLGWRRRCLMLQNELRRGRRSRHCSALTVPTSVANPSSHTRRKEAAREMCAAHPQTRRRGVDEVMNTVTSCCLPFLSLDCKSEKDEKEGSSESHTSRLSMRHGKARTTWGQA
jgi:hypothetical protein